MCGVSYARCAGCSFVRLLFGGCMVDLLAALVVSLLLSFLVVPGLCCFLRATLSVLFNVVTKE